MNFQFGWHQSITFEVVIFWPCSDVVLWCQPNNKFQQRVKIGKFIKYGNVLFYEHQVLENMRGTSRGPCVGVKGGGTGCILIRTRDGVGRT